MVHLAQLDAPPRKDGLEAAIQDRMADLDSRKYRRNNAYVLRLFAKWLQRERGVETVEAIDSQDLRQFAPALRESLMTKNRTSTPAVPSRSITTTSLPGFDAACHRISLTRSVERGLTGDSSRVQGVSPSETRMASSTSSICDCESCPYFCVIRALMSTVRIWSSWTCESICNSGIEPGRFT